MQSTAQHSTAQPTQNTRKKRKKERKKLSRNPAQTQNQASALLSLFHANTDKRCSLFIFIFVPPRISISHVSLSLYICYLPLSLSTCIVFYIHVCACTFVSVRYRIVPTKGSTLQFYKFACEFTLEQTSEVLDRTNTSFFDTYIAHTRTKR